MPPPLDMPSLDLIFTALANPTRRAMLAQLMAGDATVGALAAPFDLSQPTISSHIKILDAAGLVTRGRHATQRPVRLHPGGLAAIEAWIGPYRDLWQARLEQLETYATTLQQQDNTDDHSRD